MSQKAEILQALELAGSRGVHSFKLLSITHRYAARVNDLKAEGYEITSEPERGEGDAIGVRYTLLVGSTAGEAAGEPSRAAALGPGDGVAGGASRSRRSCTVASSASSETVAVKPGNGSSRSVPSLFDADEALDWGNAA